MMHTLHTLRMKHLPEVEKFFKEQIKLGVIEEFAVVADWRNNNDENIAKGILNVMAVVREKGSDNWAATSIGVSSLDEAEPLILKGQ